MTYTVAIRSPGTGEIGVGMTTCSIAVGGLCPFHSVRGDLVVSQAYASPDDGLIITRALDEGGTPAGGFELVRQADPHLSYRQIMVVPATGEILAHTGPDCRPWAGHLHGEHFVVAGNVLAGPQVVAAMRDSVLETEGLEIGDRLLLALEAGRAAGGQAAGDGRPLAERSAAIKVVDTSRSPGLPRLDLRVDMHFSALHELRRLAEFHKVYGEYSALRDKNPPQSPSMVEYEDRWLRGTSVVERPSVFK